MEPSAMEQAMGTPEILRNIAKSMSFDDLANARSVSKDWNKEANFWFRKRAILKSLCLKTGYQPPYGSLFDLEAFLETESKFPNKELVARIPGRVCVGGNDIQYEGLLFAEWIRLKDQRLERIQNLQLITWSYLDINRILPFILHRMPWLQEVELKFTNDYEYERPLSIGFTTQDFTIPTDWEFSVTSFSLTIDCPTERTLDENIPLDLKFLHRCRNLTKFSVKVVHCPEFALFLASYQGLSPLFRFDHVVLDLQDIYVLPFQSYRQHRNCIVKFLTISQPRELDLTVALVDVGILRKIAAQVNSVTRLSLTVGDERGNKPCEEMLRLRDAMKSLKGFPQLRELRIELLQAVGHQLIERKSKICEDLEVNGFFKNLSELEGLMKLEVTVTSDPVVELETAILALFHGYEPRIPLHLKIDSVLRDLPCQEFQFSVQQLQDAVDEFRPNTPAYEDIWSTDED